MNDLENRLRELKPKIKRDLRRELFTELPPPRPKTRFLGTLLACSCSFLLGLVVMYGVMKPSAVQEQQSEDKPPRFSSDTVAAKPKETPAPRIPAGNDYTYLTLLKKYQSP